ncbi:hypothetical protein V6N12_065523 [Hibiscus sabdariffa]|uniref:NAF domain-containing protein n=1 Tax=Hibiscus sabdariffa TaxID=183260 RepID=A0ABR2G8Z3_9ROSI
MRITIAQIRSDEWFKKGYVPVRLVEYEDINLDDVNVVFDDPEVDKEERGNEHSGNEDMGPLSLNAFGLIILSQGLNIAKFFYRGKFHLAVISGNYLGYLSSGYVSVMRSNVRLFSSNIKLNETVLYTPYQDNMKHQTRFVSQKPARVVLSSMEVVAQSMGYKTHIRNYKMRVEGLSANKTSHFSVILEVGFILNC